MAHAPAPLDRTVSSTKIGQIHTQPNPVRDSLVVSRFLNFGGGSSLAQNPEPIRSESIQVIPGASQPKDDFLALLENFFKTEIKENGTSLSGGTASTQDVVADIRFFLGTIAGIFFKDSAALDLVGITTGENSYMGAFAVTRAYQRFQKSDRIHDTGGIIESLIDLVRGANQAIAGAAYVGYRAASVAGTIITAPYVAKTAFVTGLVGNIFFTGFYACLGVWGAIQFASTAKFAFKFFYEEGQKTSSDKKMEFLFAKVHADTKVFLNKFSSKDGEIEAFKESLEEACLDAFTEKLYACQEEKKAKGENVSSRKEIRDGLVRLFEQIESSSESKDAFIQAYCTELKIDVSDVQGFSALQICGLRLHEQHRQMRKEAKLGRVLGGDLVKEIKGYESLMDLSDVDKQALVDKVTNSIAKHLVLYGSFVSFAILGILTSLALIGLLAFPPGVLVGLTIVLSLLMLGVDFHFWKMGLDSGAKPGENDKLFIKIAAAVLVTAMVLGVGLGIAFAFPVLPIVIAVVMGIALLTVFAYTHVILDQKEKEWKIKEGEGGPNIVSAEQEEKEKAIHEENFKWFFVGLESGGADLPPEMFY